MARGWNGYQDDLQRWLHRQFGWLGGLVARAPGRVAAIALLCCAALSCGLLLGRWELRHEYSYLPRKLPAFRLYEQQAALFGKEPRVAEFKASAPAGGNILHKANLLLALAAHDAVLALRADGGAGASFEAVCARAYEGGACMTDNLLVRTGLSEQRALLEEMGQEEIDTFVASLPRSTLQPFLGDLAVDGETGAVYARSMRFFYLVAERTRSIRPILPMPARESADSAAALAWEAAFLRLTHGRGWTGRPQRAEASMPARELRRRTRAARLELGPHLAFPLVDAASAAPSALAAPPAAEPPSGALSLSGIAARSVQDECTRNIEGSLTFMVGAICSIFAYTVLMLGGGALSRLWLGSAGMLVILCALLAGFGAVAALGVPFTDISLMIVFVVVGIGVDDIIVIVDFVRAQPAGLRGQDRLSRGCAEAGSAILVTSATNLVAFLCAATIDLPGVRSFCLAAGVIVFALFALTVTLFAAALAADEARLQRRGEARAAKAEPAQLAGMPPAHTEAGCCWPAWLRDGAPPDARAPTAELGAPELTAGSEAAVDAPTDALTLPDEDARKLQTAEAHGGDGGGSARTARSALACYARVASFRPLGVLLLLACCALVAGGFGLALGRLQVGVNFEDNFPDGSYVSAYFLDTQYRFGQLSDRASLIFYSSARLSAVPIPAAGADSAAQLDWSDARTQAAVLSLVAQLNALEVTTEPFACWLCDYLAHAQREAADPDARGALPAASGAGFYAGLRGWLERDEAECADDECERYVLPKAYSADIVWAHDRASILACRFRGFVLAGASVQSRIGAMRAAQDGLREHAAGLPVVLFAYYYIFAERDEVIVPMILGTLGSAAGAVLCVVLLFLAPASVLLVALAICAVDGGTLAMMAAWRTPLDIESFICLSMAVGLAVDYVVHIAHAYERVHSAEPARRVEGALLQIGGAVLKGGISTLLGVSLLAFSPSAIFRIFFQCLSSIVLLGLLMGLALMPAAAALLDRAIPAKGLPPGSPRAAGGGGEPASAGDSLSSSRTELGARMAQHSLGGRALSGEGAAVRRLEAAQ